MPYYKISLVKAEPETKPRVIEADNAATALRHAAQTVFEVSKPLKPGELVALMTGGIKPEVAGEAATAPTTDA